MKEETFLFGEVVSTPTLKWVRPNKATNECLAGFEIRFLTNSTFAGEEHVMDILCVYDLMAWDILLPGQWLKLSVKREENSKTSPSGKVLKCNIVFRK
jgi:hypothetical protein